MSRQIQKGKSKVCGRSKAPTLFDKDAMAIIIKTFVGVDHRGRSKCIQINTIGTIAVTHRVMYDSMLRTNPTEHSVSSDASFGHHFSSGCPKLLRKLPE